MKFLFSSRPWLAVYEGEGEGGGDNGGGDGQAAAAAAAKAEADRVAAEKAKNNPPPVNKVFTQDQVNKMLAEDRRKHQEQVKQTMTQLEEFKKNTQLTEQQKQELEGRLESLSNSLLTEQEKAKAELQKKEKEFKSQQEMTAKERDMWRNQFATETTKNQILQASATHDVVRSEQMIELLMPKARLVEVLGTDGKTPVGYQPKVKFKDKNEKGEDIELDLTIEDTVKRMKEQPERFGNLFKSGAVSGLGADGSTGQGGMNADEMLKDPAKYRANRKKLGLGRKS